ncbi:MAG: hypothetical protein QF473_24955 [Planctomycetota bacterium]|nr:hypothetical protein [Planctomycetota bacterium]
MELSKNNRSNTPRGASIPQDAIKGALLLGVLTTLLFSQGLVGQFLLLGRELDFISFRYLSEAREQIGQGKIPLWTSRVFCGFPLLANPELALCYPPTWLAFLLPVHRAIGVLAALHMLLSGMLAYLFFNERGLGRYGCFTAAGTWTFAGIAMSHVAHLPTLSALAWLPGLFWCMEQSVAKGGLWRHARLGAVAGIQMLAGDFGIAFVSQFGALFWMILDLGIAGREYFRRRIIECGCFMLLCGVGLSAVQGLPFVELLEQAVPQQREGVHPMHLIVPGLAGGGSLFLGVLFLPLAGSGLFRRQGIPFGVLGLTGIAFGIVAPSTHAFAALALAGLVGHGTDVIAQRSDGFSKPRKTFSGLALGVMGIGLSMTFFDYPKSSLKHMAGLSLCIGGILGIGYVFVCIRWSAFRWSVLRILVGLHVLTLFWSGGRWIPKMRVKDFEETRLEEESLVKQLSAKPGHRIVDLTTMPMAHSRWVPYGLESVSGFSRHVPNDVIRYSSIGEESAPAAGGAAYASFVSSPRMLQVAGCQYILVEANATPLIRLLDRELSEELGEPSVLKEVDVFSTRWKVFRIGIGPWDILPYGILAGANQQVELVFCPDRQCAWQGISSGKTGIPRVVLESEPPNSPAADGSDYRGLFFSRRHSRNLRAFSDAGEADIVRAHYMFASIPMADPSDLNSESFVYEPRSFRVGLYLALTMMALLCAALVAGVVRPR